MVSLSETVSMSSDLSFQIEHIVSKAADVVELNGALKTRIGELEDQVVICKKCYRPCNWNMQIFRSSYSSVILR